MKQNAIRALATLLLIHVSAVMAADKKVDFVTQIKPIFEAACINCHHSEALFGNLNLENRERAFAARKEGAVLVPGASEKSLLLIVLTLPPKETKKAMPPTGHRIEKEKVELIRAWIDQGASWPEGKEGIIKPAARSSKSAK